MISGQHVQGETTQQHEYEQHQEKILLSLAQTLAQLRVEGVEGYDPRIPVNVRPLLMNLKHGLRDLIRVTLNNTHFQWESPDEITAHILSTLQSHNISFRESWEEDARYYTYDDLEDIQLLQSLQHPNLLIATTRLWVMCGSDTSFYLFQKSGEQWQLVVAQEANNYEEISGAQGAFQYAISPPDVTGDFYIVTANINPWCSSNWQSLRYKAFRVGATPSQPKMLAQGEETIYKVTGYTITTHATKFWLLFAGDVSEYQVHWDYNSTISMHMVSYDVEGDQVKGIHFVPEDFLGTWFRMPWEEASKWVEPESLPAIEPWYTRLREIGEKSYSFSVMRPCEHNQDSWQIGVQVLNDTDSQPTEELCFTLNRRDEWYMIQGFYQTDSSGCPDTCPSNAS